MSDTLEIVLEAVNSPDSTGQFIPVFERLTSTKSNQFWVRFQVLAAVSMKMTVFCDVAPCSLVEAY
jgi:hypothetical protein